VFIAAKTSRHTHTAPITVINLTNSMNMHNCFCTTDYLDSLTNTGDLNCGPKDVCSHNIKRIIYTLYTPYMPRP